MSKSAPKKVAAAPAISTPQASGTAPAGVIEQPMVAPPPKRSDKLTRGGTSAGRPGQIVTAANRWRENYNPARALTIRRAVELLELGQRGDTAYLQWAYRKVERSYPTLSGLISRCEAPLAQFDWHIKIKNQPPPGMNPEQFKAAAQKQKETLEDAYNGVDNLRQAILHLHLADFRGYAHLQKHRTNDGDVYHLEPLHQWCVCRDGLEGNWFWNPDSRSTSAPLQFLGKDFCIGGDALPLEDFILRECPRPIDEVALINFIRNGLCEKDYDGFIEIYGIPSGVVIMPPNVPQGKEAEYEAAAKSVSEGAAGGIPYGSDYKANDGPRGVDPFTPRFKRLDETLILAGTGGKLTMMTEAGGGSQVRGSGKVHDKTFGEIADGRARNIAECFQQNFDVEVLNAQHAGEPHLVYFDFGAEEEEDLTALCGNVLTLSQAGKETDTDWLAEKTGYQLSDKVEVNPPAGPEADLTAETPKRGENQKLQNRDSGEPAALGETLHETLLPLLKRLEAIAAIEDPGIQQDMLEKLLNDFPQIADAINADNSLAKKLSPQLADALTAGLTAETQRRREPQAP